MKMSRFALFATLLFFGLACEPTTSLETAPPVEESGFFGPPEVSEELPDLPPPEGEVAYVGRMPRLAAFVGAWEDYTPAERESLAAFDLLSLRGSPDAVSEIHRRNPEARLFYRVMPQTVAAADWGRPWSWMDTVRRYVTENDWVLRHDDGGEATMRTAPYWHWLDFTRHCPVGTYYEPLQPELDSRGLTVADWLAQRFIPWFVANRFAGYEGLWWEITAARPSPTWLHVDVPDPETGGRLDWDRNGVADIDEGGWAAWDAFSRSWESISSAWVARVRAEIGDGIPIIGAGDAYAPALEQLDGFKNEDFLNRNRFNGGGWTWWDEFYGRQEPTPRRGYVLQRDHARQGWNLSVNQIFWYDNANWLFSNPIARTRYVRFALGTTLLGDGYFSFYDIQHGSVNGQPRNPWMNALYRPGISEYAYPFQRVVDTGDTLYVRYFADDERDPSQVLVVNPNQRRILNVNPRDARIFELP